VARGRKEKNILLLKHPSMQKRSKAKLLSCTWPNGICVDSDENTLIGSLAIRPWYDLSRFHGPTDITSGAYMAITIISVVIGALGGIKLLLRIHDHRYLQLDLHKPLDTLKGNLNIGFLLTGHCRPTLL